MNAAARALVLLIGAALVVSFVKGGPDRASAWVMRTLTGDERFRPKLVGSKPIGKPRQTPQGPMQRHRFPDGSEAEVAVP